MFRSPQLKGPAMRHCYRCRKDKPAAEFARDKSKGSGYKSICKSCDRERSAAYYSQNAERVIARVRRRQGATR
jgi:hypothetical protein